MNAALRTARTLPRSRTMFTVPNNVAKAQKQFTANPHLHGAENPTYLKAGSGDRTANMVAGAFVVLGVANVFKGLTCMALGINKKEDS